MERYVPAYKAAPPPVRKRKPARDASTYRGAKRNAMKTQRPYTPKDQRHKVA